MVACVTIYQTAAGGWLLRPMDEHGQPVALDVEMDKSGFLTRPIAQSWVEDQWPHAEILLKPIRIVVETISIHPTPTRALIDLLSGADGVTPRERLRAWGAVIWEQPCHAVAKDPGGSLLSLTNKGLAELIAQL